MPRRFGVRLAYQAGIVLLTMSALACSSTTELQEIKTQLADVQLQLLQLQKQGPSKDEIAALESAISSRIQELIKVGADERGELVLLAEQIDHLEGELEETNFRLTQLAQQIAATNQELRAVRSAAERASNRPPPPPPMLANPTDPQALYDTAYNDYVQGNYDLAVLGFHQYAANYPDTELTDNAVYWIGECYYLQGKFRQAVEQFEEVPKRYADSDRIPSALLKKGYAHLELGDRQAGTGDLESVICDHSGTDEAHLARQRLQELGIDVSC